MITDPPYLINYQTHRRQDKDHKFCKAIQNDDNPQLIIDLVPLLYDVMKDNSKAHILSNLKALYCFIDSDKLPDYKSFLKLFDLADGEYLTALTDKIKYVFEIALQGATANSKNL